jgi:hypothetical protein
LSAHSKTSVAFHGGSSHFFRIVFTLYQIQPVSVFFGLYCCTVSFGRNTFLRFRGNSFLEIPQEFLFFFIRRVKCTKRGPRPPLLRKKWAPNNFLRGSRQSFDTENTDRVFLRYRYGKYREILTDTPTEKYRLGVCNSIKNQQKNNHCPTN